MQLPENMTADGGYTEETSGGREPLSWLFCTVGQPALQQVPS